MNFTELVAHILKVTGRADRLLEIRKEVNAAANFFSTDMNAARDVVEATYPINPGEYTQALSLSNFARFRKFQYIKRAGTREFLSPLDAKKMFTSDCNMADRYYIVGASVNISMTKLAENLDIAHFQHAPVMTDASPNYWLLESAWPVILDRALAKVFALIGDDKSAQRHDGYATMGWLSKRADLEREQV